MKFPIAIHKDEGSVYGVTVPDIPGCHSWGDSVDDAIANVEEAISVHVESLIDAGHQADLHASAIEDIQSNQEYAGAIWALVDIDLASLDPTPERVNVSLPRFVLHRIDNYTKAHHETRSGFLAKAALRELELT